MTTTMLASDRGLRNDDGDVVGGQGIDDASEVSETTTEAAGDQ